MLRPAHCLILICTATATIAACAPPVNRVQRAALVPHQSPVIGDGQPLSGNGQLELGAVTLAQAGNATDGDSGASVQIPGLQANAGIRAKLSRYVDVGFRYERGFVAGSDPVNDTQPKIENRDVHSYTIAMRFAIPTKTPGLSFGVGIDLQNHSIPWVEHRVCVDNCIGVPPYTVDEGRQNVSGVGVGIAPSYKQGQWTWFGGFSVRSHPTIERKGTEVGYWNDPDVENGPAQFIASAGASIDIAESAKITALIYQPLGKEPVRYRPAMGAYFAVPF